MNNKIYWIWLQNALKFGNGKVRNINEIYGDIKKFYAAGEKEWRLCGLFSSKEVSCLCDSTIDKAVEILDKSISLGYKVFSLEDEEYPEKLKDIANPPCLIYVDGDIGIVKKSLCVSVVGARAATLRGKQVAFRIAYDLSKSGAIVVSGGALGIDTAAHLGALNSGGKTIAVLGCGINCEYLSENFKLRKEISKNGALISEYPPDHSASPINFPIRNRIISGLSSGTLVVEAEKKSGSLITAKLANSQKRDVFVILDGVNSNFSQGTSILVKDGAKTVTCAQDILDEYNVKGKSRDIYKKDDSGILCKGNPKLADSRDVFQENESCYREVSLPDYLPKECRNVYLYIKNHKRSHIDKISLDMKIEIKSLLPVITQLEIGGFIKSYPGKTYGVE